MIQPGGQDWLSTKRVFLIVIFLGIIAMSARDLTDPDVWWHLKTGQLIAHNRAVPRVDPFSFTRSGAPWVAHEWLSELIIYGVYRMAGWSGLILVFALIVSAAFVPVYLRSDPNPYCSGLILLLGAWATAPLWGVRPQMISLLLTSLWLLILQRSEHNPRLLWWTLPLTVLWVNLHAGFALGLALVLLFLAGEFLERLGSPSFSSDARLRPLAIAFLLDLALVPLNPNSFKMYLYPIETLRSQAMQSYIAEWASPNFHHAEYLPFLILLLAATASLPWAGSRHRRRDVLLLLVGTFAALSSIRMIPLFVLISVPMLAHTLSALRPERLGAGSRLGSSRWRVPARSARYLNAFILAAVASFVLFQITRVAHRQPQVEARRFPAGAVAYLESHRPTGRLFNLYDWGGYLIWKLNPPTPVFIDGRADLYGATLMKQFADTYRLNGDWQKTLQTWGIVTVLVDPNCALAVALQHAPGWKIVYADPQSLLLEQALPESPPKLP